MMPRPPPQDVLKLHLLLLFRLRTFNTVCFELAAVHIFANAVVVYIKKKVTSH